ncbi:ROK family transcriptional regulator [Acuticoccus kandeliae]|uniref:ROK family transcriptional regulator n=1 Tax=Acuticoccus kandeliae TaxID=2073160 RepID=UPI000D3EB2C9|nr:ROK family protein [Acuticoccus kandeliae]
MQKRNVQSVRDHNRSLILRLLHRRPGLSRSELVTLVGLTDAAVSRITREMIDAGLIVEGVATAVGSGPGRRHVGLALAPGGATVLAACLTLFETCLSLVDLSGNVIAERSLSDHMALPADQIAEAIANEALELVSSDSKVLGLGVVVAGALDHERGLLRAASMPALVGTPFRPLLEARLKIPVQVDNLGNALNMADLGDRTGVPHKGTTMLVHVAVGLGASLVIDGRPHRHGGDERLLGHIPVVGATGLCHCGQTGCLNTLVSGYGILTRLSGGHRPKSTASRAEDADRLSAIIRAAREGDAALNALFLEAGEVLGRHLFPVSVAAAPDRLTLAGPMAQIPAYAEGVRHGLDAAFGRAGVVPPPVRISRIGYADASRIFALEEFLLNSPIEMKRVAASSAEMATH